MTKNIKTLQLIHLAICAGITLVYFLIGEITIDQLIDYKIKTDELVYLAIPVGALFVSNFLFKSQLKQVDPKLSLEEKLPLYQTASIIRWAVLEGAAFMILFIAPNQVVFGILLIAYLIFMRPTEDKIKNEFQTS